MFASIFLLFVVQTFLCPAKANEISCRSIASVNWDEVGEQKTCDLSISAAIDIDNVRFEGEADDTIGALDLRALSTNSFLPIEVDAKFPALVLYQSCCASIKTISKKNFKNLSSLRFLSLADNQIEKIPNDTFEDLKALEWIELRMHFLSFKLSRFSEFIHF